MKLALAQINTTGTREENAAKAVEYIQKAKDADFILFPEAQLTKFFPQYRETEVQEKLGFTKEELVVTLDDPCVQSIINATKEAGIYSSPNFYVKENDKNYDMSLIVNPDGEIVEKAKMVHILNAPCFWEKDYYTPSEDGFKVVDTPFGRIGIVICYDRHLPESIRTCAVMGAELIIIPTVNTTDEDMEMFEWELRVQAFQSNVWIAMCNKVGLEDTMNFAGESIVIDPNGKTVFKADGTEQLAVVDIDLQQAGTVRANRPYITTRRADQYR